jgi:hypothetical protein
MELVVGWDVGNLSFTIEVAIWELGYGLWVCWSLGMG